MDPEIGVITALPVETVAVRHVLGGKPLTVHHASNRYDLVRLACGPVVSTMMVTTGTTAAADTAVHLVSRYPSVRVIVMCGIALGVPRPGVQEQDLRLGDVVVGSAGIVHYSHRRVTDEGSELRGETLPASPRLMRGVNEIKAAELRGVDPWRPLLDSPPSEPYRRPDPMTDPLPGGSGRSEALYGRIGSGDELLRSSVRRDELAGKALLAIEMEGAGVAVSAALGGRECLVIRGISDYGDAHKSNLWQPYASLAAASYLRAVLDSLGASASGATPALAATLRPMDIVRLLERVPSLQNPRDRDVMLEMLGPPVSHRVGRDERTMMALRKLVMICLEYPYGLRDLVAVLFELEGKDSLSVGELAATLGLPPAGHS